MNTDQMLRDSEWKQERTRERELCDAITRGEICAYCYDELSDPLRPCGNCQAKEHLRALLTDAMSFYGINADIAAAIIYHGNDRRDKAFFRHTRKAAANVLREARARYR